MDWILAIWDLVLVIWDLVKEYRLVSSLGLMLDIGGAYLLFRYGVASDVSAKGYQFVAIPGNDEELAEGKRHARLSRTGIVLLIVGFIFQLTGQYIPAPLTNP